MTLSTGRGSSENTGQVKAIYYSNTLARSLRRLPFTFGEDEWWKRFDDHFFVFATAPKTNLRDQTLDRAAGMRGIFPPGLRSATKEKKLAYLKERFIMYIRSEENSATVGKIRGLLQGEGNKRCLVTVVMDEAHYAATSTVAATGMPSPYGELMGLLKAEEYANLVVICVTATPYNLMTANRKCVREQVFGYSTIPESP